MAEKVIVLDRDHAFEFKLDDEAAQEQVIRDAKKYGMAVLKLKTDYISRGAARETLLTAYPLLQHERLDTVVSSIPAADVRPVARGKWITHPRETWIGVDINGNETQPRQFFAYECPFCGFTTGISGKDYHFCPNCGADMREES